MAQEWPGAVAYQFSVKRFGGPTAPRESAPTVNTVPSRVLDNNPRRVSWLLINTGASDIFIAFSNINALSNPIRLSALGGFISMDVEDDGEAVAWEVFGTGPAAGVTFYALEIIVVTEAAA